MTEPCKTKGEQEFEVKSQGHWKNVLKSVFLT